MTIPYSKPAYFTALGTKIHQEVADVATVDLYPVMFLPRILYSSGYLSVSITTPSSKPANFTAVGRYTSKYLP